MNPCDIIRKKRMGQELTEMEIRAFVDGVVDGSFADYQISALLMAICINGMTDRETLALTLARICRVRVEDIFILEEGDPNEGPQ